MTPPDVYPGEMDRNPNDVDAELDRLLTGHPHLQEGSRELSMFVEEVQGAFRATPLASEEQHFAAMSDAIQLLADKGNPVVRPVSNANEPAPQASWLPKLRRIQMRERLVRTVLTKVLAPVVALFTLFGGLAYAGALPDPLQSAASDVGGFFGLDIDDGDEADDVADVDEAPDADTGATGVSGATGATGAESDDDQGEDADEVEGEDDSQDTEGSDDSQDTEGSDDSQDTEESDDSDDSSDSEDSGDSQDAEGSDDSSDSED
jgi:hypothetical protein